MKNKTWSKTKNGLRFHYPSKSYYVNVKVDGRNWQRSCKTNIEKDALEFRDKFLATVRAPGGVEKYRPTNTDLTLAPYISEYRATFALVGSPGTEKCKDDRLASLQRNWLAFRGNPLAEENPKKITVPDLMTFQNKLSVDYGSDMVAVQMNMFCRILDLVAEAIPGFVPAYKNRGFRTVRRAQTGRKSLKLPSEAEFAAVVAALPPAKHANVVAPADLACALAYTGLRIDEAQRLRRQHVHLRAGYLVLTEDIVKGGQKRGQRGADEIEARSIPLCPAAMSLFARLVKDLKESDLVFCRTANINRHLAAACAKVGCSKLSHHGLRHWFATLALEKTGDAKQVAEWLGHRDGGKLVWALYGHTRKENEKKLAAKLNFDWSAAA